MVRLVLTTLKNPARFRSYVEGQLSTLSANSKKAPGIRFVDDPMSEMKPTTVNTPSDLYV